MREAAGGSRTRTVTWKDTRDGVAAARSLSGLEYLRAILRGDVPGAPIAAVLGFAPVEVVHVGARTATAQAKLTDASGKLYAHGTTTCMLFRLPAAGGRE
ncbi:hypothetical protein [Myxococcus sp. SDU36]|uniref:hypothetical protein n=1 Tax=Myxococcus sp. SDU36 TaxID=2831967 RepID=UPI00254334A9|nr:hypothetical protein [Myxococcus sp. SDU36]WIG98464.1 hypothetical protein KGD87_14350 [Myxococcus sp. SDU36]